MARIRFVEANGLRFEVLEEGDGPDLALLLHGFPEHAISWRHQMAPLASMGWRVWAPNNRGYGRSTRPQGVQAYALDRLVADVRGLIDASGARRVALVGHDWGAALAWCVAAIGDERLDRLVIMNVPHPLCFRAALRHWRQRRKSWYIAFFQLPVLPDRLLGAGGGRAVRRMFAPLALPDDVLSVYARQIAEPGAATAMLNWYRALRFGGIADAVLRQVITVPTLVIWGDRDVALDPICLDGTDRYVRDLRIERLPGVSHWVQQDAPDRVNALLADFLRQRRRQASAGASAAAASTSRPRPSSR